MDYFIMLEVFEVDFGIFLCVRVEIECVIIIWVMNENDEVVFKNCFV